MSRNKATKESPPFRLLGTMILLVLGLVVAYATLAIGILSLVQQLVHLEPYKLKLKPYGSGHAWQQKPPPGSEVLENTTVEVWFN